jgi:hypothetical protein
MKTPIDGRLEVGAWIGLGVLLAGAVILAALVMWLMS